MIIKNNREGLISKYNQIVLILIKNTQNSMENEHFNTNFSIGVRINLTY